MHNEPSLPWPRRRFLQGMALGSAAPLLAATDQRADYGGPNVILVRFGGGVRRRETIDPEHTYAPWMRKEFARQGTLFTDMVIDANAGQAEQLGINTSHGEGTLYLLTGTYRKFQDIGDKYDHTKSQLLGARFEADKPTLFEYLRSQYKVPEHQTLIINGEDRTQEEFYSFSNHHLFGAQFKSETLSLFRYKLWLYQRQIAEGTLPAKQLKKLRADVAKMKELDYRISAKNQPAEIEALWTDWRRMYGDSGFVNERGDRLLTDLALRAMQTLKPKLMMINYNDPDYVHWGNMTHYTRGIAIIDRGIRQLYHAAQNDPAYRDNTLFVLVPDCGRDTNPFGAIPCQHHFNSLSSHQIWALLVGPGIDKGKVVDRQVQQIDVAKTIGHAMGFKADLAEGGVLEEAFI